MTQTQNKKQPLRYRLQSLVTTQEAEQIAALATVRGESVSHMLRVFALAEVRKHEGAVKQMQQARAAARKGGDDEHEDSSSK